jgi:hypothetical protein
MRYFKYFLLLTIFGLLLSCDSPNQVVNESPLVTITCSDSTLALGDTLKINLHITNLSLANGTLDFKDGNIIVFNNLKSVFDTTLTHYYKNVGSYDITASFTNGDKTITKNINVVISKSVSQITLLTNTTELNVYDTLKVTLHVSNATLLHGSLDFHDGTIISFSKLNRVCDTVLVHKFTTVGQRYIAASFTDGDTTITAGILIQISDKPFVHMKANTSNLRLGDTLKLSLHVSDPTLSDGSLDFEDGTVIYFSKLNHVLDTMITYVYSQPGEYYIKVTFNDGRNPYIGVYGVMVYRYYELSLAVGMQWRYKYHYHYDQVINGPVYIDKPGTRVWKIISFSSQDSAFTVEQAACDTVYGHDSTYTVNSSSQFTIVALYKTIQFNLPFGGSPYILPNHNSVDSYPIKVPPTVYNGNSYLICTDIVGPTAYHYDSSTKYSNTLEELTLIDFIKP